MTGIRFAVALVALVAAPPCARAIEPAVANAPGVHASESTGDGTTGDWTTGADPIGVATRQPDGSLVLTLRAEGDHGAVGDARFRYAPTDPAYADIARHLGPIPPGGSVPVRPFGGR